MDCGDLLIGCRDAAAFEIGWFSLGCGCRHLNDALVVDTNGDLRYNVAVQQRQSSMIKAERVDREIYRVCQGEDVVALALRLANGRWCLADTNGVRTGRASYPSPKAAATAFAGSLQAGGA